MNDKKPTTLEFARVKELVEKLSEHGIAWMVVELEQSLRDMESRLQKAEQRASQAETAAGDCKFQNERLVDRVKQAEEALRELYDHVSTGGSYCSNAHPTSCKWMRKAWALSASTPTEQ